MRPDQNKPPYFPIIVSFLMLVTVIWMTSL